MFEARSFTDCQTEYADGKITFKYQVTRSDRARFLTDDSLESKLELMSDPVLIECNPESVEISKLVELLRASQDSRPDKEFIHATYDLPEEFNSEIDWNTTYGEKNGEVTLVFVAFLGEKIVGQCTIVTTIIIEPSVGATNRKNVSVVFGPRLVYVLTEYRGRGYGYDLSVACGVMLSDMLTAIYRSVEDNSIITPIAHSDFESRGGVCFTMQIVSTLNCLVDDVRDFENRQSVQIDYVELDAGY